MSHSTPVTDKRQDEENWQPIDTAPNGIDIIVRGRNLLENLYRDGWTYSNPGEAPLIPREWRNAREYEVLHTVRYTATDGGHVTPLCVRWRDRRQALAHATLLRTLGHITDVMIETKSA